MRWMLIGTVVAVSLFVDADASLPHYCQDNTLSESTCLSLNACSEGGSDFLQFCHETCRTPTQEDECTMLQSTASPTSLPTSIPTFTPTSSAPTSIPSAAPSTKPSVVPSAEPSMTPSSAPSRKPSVVPTPLPSTFPTPLPTHNPSSEPTSSTPSRDPTRVPTNSPSHKPTGMPSSMPSGRPTVIPSGVPSGYPSSEPSRIPTGEPTSAPTSTVPTDHPSSVPTLTSIAPTAMPSAPPTQTAIQTISFGESFTADELIASRSSEYTFQNPLHIYGDLVVRGIEYSANHYITVHEYGRIIVMEGGTMEVVHNSALNSSLHGSGNVLVVENGGEVLVVNGTLRVQGDGTQPTNGVYGNAQLLAYGAVNIGSYRQYSAALTVMLGSVRVAGDGHVDTCDVNGVYFNQGTVQGVAIYFACPETDGPTMSPTQSPSSSSPTTSPTQSTTTLTTTTKTSTTTVAPTSAPTEQPTRTTSTSTSEQPAVIRWDTPTQAPTYGPSFTPTAPTAHPSESPTEAPSTAAPTSAPSDSPTVVPSAYPSSIPTSAMPTRNPTFIPTAQPTTPQPTTMPSRFPTSSIPTFTPTAQPTTPQPTIIPSRFPTSSIPTLVPSSAPHSSLPTALPTTSAPSQLPSIQPTASSPTRIPSAAPHTSFPTKAPTTLQPTDSPTSKPIANPTEYPTREPTMEPTFASPTVVPTSFPTTSLPTTATPTTGTPSSSPTTAQPTATPSAKPTFVPTTSPSTSIPTPDPSHTPTREPTITLPICQIPDQALCRLYSCSEMSARVKSTCGLQCGLCQLATTVSPTSSTPSKSPTSSPTLSMPTASPMNLLPTFDCSTPDSALCDLYACNLMGASLQSQCPIKCGLCIDSTTSNPEFVENASSTMAGTICADSNSVLCASLTARCGESEVASLCQESCGLCSTLAPINEIDRAAGFNDSSDSASITIFVICGVIALIVFIICVATIWMYKRQSPKPINQKKGPIFGIREENYRNNPILDMDEAHHGHEDLAWEQEQPGGHSQTMRKLQFPRYSDQFKSLARNLQTLDSAESDEYSQSSDGTRRDPDREMIQHFRQEKARKRRHQEDSNVQSAGETFDMNPGIRDAFVNFMLQLNMEPQSTTETSSASDDQSSGTSYMKPVLEDRVTTLRVPKDVYARPPKRTSRKRERRSRSPSAGSYVEINPENPGGKPLKSILRPQIGSEASHHLPSKVDWMLPSNASQESGGMMMVVPDSSYQPSKSQRMESRTYTGYSASTDDRDFSERLYDNCSIVMPKSTGGDEHRPHEPMGSSTGSI